MCLYGVYSSLSNTNRPSHALTVSEAFTYYCLVSRSPPRSYGAIPALGPDLHILYPAGRPLAQSTISLHLQMARIEEIDSFDAGASPAPHGIRAHGPDRGESGNLTTQTNPTHPAYADIPMSLGAHGDASYAEVHPPTPADGSTYRPISVTTLSYTAHGVHTINPRGLVHISRGHSPPYMHIRAHTHAFAHARNARRRQAMRTNEDVAGRDSPLDEKLQKRRHAWPPPRATFKAHPSNQDEVMPMCTPTEDSPPGVASAPALDTPLRRATSSESHSAPVTEKSRGWVMNDREMDAVSAALARFSC